MKEVGPGSATQRRDGASLWEWVSARGMGRRQFLRLMMVGGATAVLAACVGAEPPDEKPQPQPTQASSGQASNPSWLKDPTPFTSAYPVALYPRRPVL